jgi:hypothetical protein
MHHFHVLATKPHAITRLSRNEPGATGALPVCAYRVLTTMEAIV